MNLLNQMQAIFGQEQRGFATVNSVRPDGKLVATTPTGAVVLLDGKAEVGKNVFYDRVSGKVLGDAPNVEFKEYGV